MDLPLQPRRHHPGVEDRVVGLGPGVELGATPEQEVGVLGVGPRPLLGGDPEAELHRLGLALADLDDHVHHRRRIVGVEEADHRRAVDPQLQDRLLARPDLGDVPYVAGVDEQAAADQRRRGVVVTPDDDPPHAHLGSLGDEVVHLRVAPVAVEGDPVVDLGEGVAVPGRRDRGWRSDPAPPGGTRGDARRRLGPRSASLALARRAVAPRNRTFETRVWTPSWTRMTAW